MDLKEAKVYRNIDNRHPWELAKLDVVHYLIKKYFPNFLHRKRVCIDIGCGDIFFAEQLAERMPYTTFLAVDTSFDQEALTRYKKWYSDTRIEVYNSTDDLILNSYGTADLILLLDVLEHIKDDVAFLKRLQSFEFISDNTLFLITAPAFQSLFCSHDHFLEHYRRYNLKSLRARLHAANLTELGHGYFFTVLLKLRIFQVLLEKIHKPLIRNTQVGNWRQKGYMNKLMKNILIIDFKFSCLLKEIGLTLPGLSIYIICKKSVL
ncbi:MAG: methyltransferase domain-containing protein [Desulfobacterales bacterium]|nr:methyltransferase domain-containing protein [Desulfobacterales bacterium]